MASGVTFGGLASGIDSAGIIQALLGQQRNTRITPLENQIEKYTDTNTSLSKLSELLRGLSTAADKFRTVNGGGIAKAAVSSDETILTASANAAATPGSYSVNVTQLARNGTTSLRSSLGSYSSSDSAINPNIDDGTGALERTISITTGTGGEAESVAVELTSTTTLSQFVESFNSQSEKANAAVVNVGTSTSPDYRVVITSKNTGIEKGQISVSVGAGITDPDGNPVTDDGAFDNNALSQALNAEFSVSGITGSVTRSTNSVTDLFAGVTFQLQAVGTAVVSINADASSSSAQVQDFVSAYNDLVNYINENDAVVNEGDSSGQSENIFNPLANTSVDESILGSLRESFRGLTSTGTYGSFAELGLSTQRDGTLKFDAAAFTAAVEADPTSVASLTESLGNNLAGVDGKIAQFTRFGGILDKTINSNKGEITNLNDRIANVEKNLLSYEASLNQQYSRFEALIGKLNSQQNALSSLIGG